MELKINRMIVLHTIVIFMTLFTSCDLESQKNGEQQEVSIYQKVSPAAFQEKMKAETAAYKIVDVRTAQEYANGAIANSENHDVLNGDFEANMQDWNKEEPIYIYCAKGGRSSKAAKMLQDQGFNKIIELKGGYTSWKLGTN